MELNLFSLHGQYFDDNENRLTCECTSVVTPKPAIRGHFKTGHRDWAKTRLFYSPEGVAGKVARLTSSIKRFTIADGR